MADLGLRRPLPGGAPYLLWGLVVVDLVALLWMLALGDWTDRWLPFGRLLTLDGHPTLVIVLAAIGIGILVVLALLTQRFTAATPLENGALSLAGVLSVGPAVSVLGIVMLAFACFVILALLIR
jgi:hypothetical protein